MNYQYKELVRSFDWSDFGRNREIEKRVEINGRIYYKTGTYTATTIVGDLYRLNDSSEKQFNYVLLIGVARQHPNDDEINFAQGVEIAAENAKINPIMIFKLNNKVDWNFFRNIAENYVYSLRKQFIKTKSEKSLSEKYKEMIENPF